MSAVATPPRLARLLHFIAVIVLTGLACGCNTVGYYGQAIRGQHELWTRQKSIHALLESPATPAPLKERLSLVLRLREFAEKELHLPANGHYLHYADLERRFVVWNVYAAPEFSLTPKSWWYPVVGRLDYRGYFSERKARDYAAALEQKGFDVYVGGVTAYSTLGWFHDPVLNTFIHEDDADLAELLFHELAHQRLFLPGDTEFNEAFATAVAEEGVRRWMESRNDVAALEKYRVQARRTEQFVTLVANARQQLALLYTSSPGVQITSSRDTTAQSITLRAGKQKALRELREGYAQLKAKWGGSIAYDEWFRRSLNNAQLNTVDAYYHLVPTFQRVLREKAGNLEMFYAAIESLRKLDKPARRARLTALAIGTGQAAAE